MTKHKEVLELALDTHIKNESHRTVEESRYWCDQYKLLAQTAIKALARQEQEPVQCWKCGDMDSAFHSKCDVPACGMKEGKKP